MDGTAASAELWSTSIGKAGRRALAASWLGWMFDGYETYAIVLVIKQAVGEFLPPEKHATLSLYVGGLLAATLLGWATGGVSAGVLTDLYRPQAHADDLDTVVRRFRRSHCSVPKLLVPARLSISYGARTRSRMGTWDRYRRGILAAFAPWTNWGCTSCRPRGWFFPRVWYLVFRESARLMQFLRAGTTLMLAVDRPPKNSKRLRDVLL